MEVFPVSGDPCSLVIENLDDNWTEQFQQWAQQQGAEFIDETSNPKPDGDSTVPKKQGPWSIESEASLIDLVHEHEELWLPWNAVHFKNRNSRQIKAGALEKVTAELNSKFDCFNGQLTPKVVHTKWASLRTYKCRRIEKSRNSSFPTKEWVHSKRLDFLNDLYHFMGEINSTTSINGIGESVLDHYSSNAANINDDTQVVPTMWNHDTERELISLAQGYPLLYNEKHPSYKKKNLKILAINQITKTLNTTNEWYMKHPLSIEDVQEKWSRLRLHMLDNIKTVQQRHMRVRAKRKDWVHFEAMKFVLPENHTKPAEDSGDSEEIREDSVPSRYWNYRRDAALIETIKKHPELWDPNITVYKRSMLILVYDKITHHLNTTVDTFMKDPVPVQEVQKRWNILRRLRQLEASRKTNKRHKCSGRFDNNLDFVVTGKLDSEPTQEEKIIMDSPMIHQRAPDDLEGEEEEEKEGLVLELDLFSKEEKENSEGGNSFSADDTEMFSITKISSNDSIVDTDEQKDEKYETHNFNESDSCSAEVENCLNEGDKQATLSTATKTSELQWTFNATISLIEAVENYPLLWMPLQTDAVFSLEDKRKKRSCWTCVTEHLNGTVLASAPATIKDVYRHWTKLHKHKQRCRTLELQGLKFRRCWKYSKHLSFLLIEAANVEDMANVERVLSTPVSEESVSVPSSLKKGVTRRWSNSQTFFLIEMVQGHPEVWFSDDDHTRFISITRHLNLNIPDFRKSPLLAREVQARFAALKSHRLRMHRQQMRGKSVRTNWPFFHRLNFLLDVKEGGCKDSNPNEGSEEKDVLQDWRITAKDEENQPPRRWTSRQKSVLIKMVKKYPELSTNASEVEKNEIWEHICDHLNSVEPEFYRRPLQVEESRSMIQALHDYRLNILRRQSTDSTSGRPGFSAITQQTDSSICALGDDFNEFGTGKIMRRWGEEQIFELIRLVKRHPVLWSGACGHSIYRSRDWQTVVSQLNAKFKDFSKWPVTTKEARKKFANLRTYKVKLHRQKGEASEHYWWYSKSLDFLINPQSVDAEPGQEYSEATTSPTEMEPEYCQGAAEDFPDRHQNDSSVYASGDEVEDFGTGKVLRCWSHEQVFELNRAVEQYPVLWAGTGTKFDRFECWQAVTHRLNKTFQDLAEWPVTIREVQKKFANLRTYKIKLHRLKDSASVRYWRYSKSLDFLIAHLFKTDGMDKVADNIEHDTSYRGATGQALGDWAAAADETDVAEPGQECLEAGTSSPHMEAEDAPEAGIKKRRWSRDPIFELIRTVEQCPVLWSGPGHNIERFEGWQAVTAHLNASFQEFRETPLTIKETWNKFANLRTYKIKLHRLKDSASVRYWRYSKSLDFLIAQPHQIDKTAASSSQDAVTYYRVSTSHPLNIDADNQSNESLEDSSSQATEPVQDDELYDNEMPEAAPGTGSTAEDLPFTNATVSVGDQEPREWTRAQLFMLIKTVEKYPEVWHDGGVNEAKKSYAWERVTAFLNKHISAFRTYPLLEREAKANFSHLRNQKLKLDEWEAAGKITSNIWPYSKSLDFLLAVKADYDDEEESIKEQQEVRFSDRGYCKQRSGLQNDHNDQDLSSGSRAREQQETDGDTQWQRVRWSRQGTFRLLEEVLKHPELWDERLGCRKHRKYIIWEDVAQVLNGTVRHFQTTPVKPSEAMRKFLSLRQYKLKLEREKKNFTMFGHTIRWSFDDAMDFILRPSNHQQQDHNTLQSSSPCSNINSDGCVENGDKSSFNDGLRSEDESATSQKARCLWSRKSTLALIKEVQKYPEIVDEAMACTRMEKYIAFNKVARSLNVSDADCIKHPVNAHAIRKKYTNLRAYKLLKSKQLGHQSTTTNYWQFSDDLNFLATNEDESPAAVANSSGHKMDSNDLHDVDHQQTTYHKKTKKSKAATSKQRPLTLSAARHKRKISAYRGSSKRRKHEAALCSSLDLSHSSNQVLDSEEVNDSCEHDPPTTPEKALSKKSSSLCRMALQQIAYAFEMQKPSDIDLMDLYRRISQSCAEFIGTARVKQSSFDQEASD